MSTTVDGPKQSSPVKPADQIDAGEDGSDDGANARLTRIERRLETQSLEAKKTRRAYGIFAVLALCIAMVNLLAVTFKLDDKNAGGKASKAAQPAPAAPTPAALSHRSSVTLAEYSIAPRPSQAAAGKVTFKLHNAGQLKHEFVVLRTNRKASQLLKGNEADEAGNVGEVGDLPPGQTRSLRLRLKAGHYALICNLPGHYKLGQRADFTVK